MGFKIRNAELEKIPLTLKWKIAIESQSKEQALLYEILKHLSENTKLRLDANAGLSRKEAQEWANHFHKDSRLEWLEQPLPADDFEGLSALAKQGLQRVGLARFLFCCFRRSERGFGFRP